jgi:hypothetical protein
LNLAIIGVLICAKFGIYQALLENTDEEMMEQLTTELPAHEK